jgi:hypothetical protein
LVQERCQKQQRRIEELEGENLLLASSRTQLHSEVCRLHEAGLRMRERNLQLSHQLQVSARFGV